MSNSGFKICSSAGCRTMVRWGHRPRKRKNRPRGVPQAGLYVQYRDIQGNLLNTWEQPISGEAKNSAELLTVSIDKQLSEGTLEVYLQNGSKNEVYYWGLQTVKNIVDVVNKIAKEAPKKPSPARNGGCSVDFYFRGEAKTAKVTGATDNNDLESQGWVLEFSIPFDCGTGKTGGGGDVPSETASYDVFQEFRRQVNESNNQGGGGGGGGSGSGGNPQGPITVGGPDEDPEKQRKCAECTHNAHQAYVDKELSLKSKLIGKTSAICHWEAIGVAVTIEGLIAWANATPPSAIVLGIAAVISGIVVDIYCLVDSVLEYKSGMSDRETEYIDALNNCDSRYCK